MLKRHYKQLSFVLLIFIMLFIINNQYQTKKMYEKHISMNLNSEINTMVRGIVNGYNIYDEILNSGEITKRQGQLLRTYIRDIIVINNEYINLATDFNRISNAQAFSETLENIQEVFSFWVYLTEGKNFELEELDDLLIALDSNQKYRVEYFKELHSFWLVAAESNIVGVTISNGDANFSGYDFNHYYGGDSLLDNFWVDLIVDLDKETRNFLNKYEIKHINELLEANLFSL